MATGSRAASNVLKVLIYIYSLNMKIQSMCSGAIAGRRRVD